MKFKAKSITAENNGFDVVLTLHIPFTYGKQIESVVASFEAKNEYELKQVRKKRSLDANAYFWLLADEIAKVLNTTKENVYWEVIKRVGVFETLRFANEESMNRFNENWKRNGLGWLTYIVDAEKCILQVYYGSSRYNSQEFSRLLDETIEEAKRLGIETRPQEEIDSMLKEWSESGGR